MSLHKFAEQVAANGRGDDSLLVHMTPDEVRKLQQFAEANGTTLTINPETGLPEAGLLSDLFKTVAPIALGAFLGPAGLAFGGGMMSAGMAGLTVGGLTTLATGSLSRGLMAGLGAYGGAGLGEGLMNAGATGAASEAAAQAAAQQQLSAANMALGEAMPAQAAEQFTKDAVARSTAPMAKLGAGLESLTSSPKSALAFAKDNWKPLAAAAAPIMAGAMVPTTTKMPAETNPAYIRQKLYDPYTQTYKSLTPVKASEWGSRSFSDAYTNPQTGQMATLDVRKPEPMATGGIVALADGGKLDTNSDIYKYFADPATQALLKSGNDSAIAAQMQAKDWTAAQIAAATGTQNQQADYERRFTQAVNTPTTDATEFLAATKDVGLQNQALANALSGSGLSAAGQYASTHGLADTGGVTGTDFYKNVGYTAGALPGDKGGLEGLYANINYSATGLQDQINAGKMTVAQAQDAALAEMNRVGVSQGDIKAATGKTFGELFAPKTETKVVPPPFTSVVPGGTQLPGATVYDNGAFGNYGSGPATGVDYKGDTVSIATPGDIVTNPDGTRTVVPNIPGRPYGGFTGMEGVKSAYTAGGGSLGYTAKAPRTIEEFNQLYNKQTGDSLAAYDYLMGKGGGKYPVQSQAAATGINRPYWGEGMRYKPKFLSYGKEGELVTSTTNPNAPKSGDAKAADLTKAKTITVVDSSGYDTQTYTAVLQEDGTYLAGNGKRYDVTGKELAAGGGMMGYASGGITGDGNLNLHIPLDFGGGGGGGYTPMGGGFSSSNSSYSGSSGGFNGQNNTAGGGFGGGRDLGYGNGTPPRAIRPTNVLPFVDDAAQAATPLGGMPASPSLADYGAGLAGMLTPYSGGRPANVMGGDYTGGKGFAPGAVPAGLDDFDMASPAVMAANAANQQKNAASRANTAANPASMSDLARRLGIGSGASEEPSAVGTVGPSFSTAGLFANGGMAYAMGGGLGSLGGYSDGGRLLKGPGDGVSDSIPATIGAKNQPARLADGEFVIPARIVSELGNGSTEAGAKKLYAMMDRVQKARGKTTGKNKVAANSRADKHLPA